MHDSCQNHNCLISTRPSWRQLAGFGLLQDLWFGLGLWGLWSAAKSHLFWRAFLLYASHMHVLSALWRKVNLSQGLLCLFLYLLYLLRQTTVQSGEQDWFGQCLSLSHSLPPFYLLIIKSYHSCARFTYNWALIIVTLLLFSPHQTDWIWQSTRWVDYNLFDNFPVCYELLKYKLRYVCA